MYFANLLINVKLHCYIDNWQTWCISSINFKLPNDSWWLKSYLFLHAFSVYFDQKHTSWSMSEISASVEVIVRWNCEIIHSSSVNIQHLLTFLTYSACRGGRVSGRIKVIARTAGGGGHTLCRAVMTHWTDITGHPIHWTVYTGRHCTVVAWMLEIQILLLWRRRLNLRKQYPLFSSSYNYKTFH